MYAQEFHKAMGDEIRRRGAAARERFTSREREILARLADGQSMPTIAAELLLSQSTVKTHLRSLYEKLGVSDRAAAVAVGMRRGLIR